MVAASVIEPLSKTIEWALLANYLKTLKHPISLLVIADAESGKSTTFSAFEKHSLVASVRELTPAGLLKDDREGSLLQQFFKQGKKCLLFPDFNSVVAKKSSSVKGTLAFLNDLTWDGLHDGCSFFIPRPEKELIGIKMALFAGITADVYHSSRYLQLSGFSSRMLPFSYTLNAEEKAKIKTQLRENLPLVLPRINECHAKLLNVRPMSPDTPAAKKFWAEIEDVCQISLQQTGFRRTEQICTMTMACAASHGKSEVDAVVLNEVLAVAQFWNLNGNIYPVLPDVEKVFHTGGVAV